MEAGLVLLIGLITGFLDSLVGSGGLVSIPALIWLGLPPAMAVATDRFGTLGQTLSAIYIYHKAKKIVFAYLLPLLILSGVGAWIGARLLVQIDQKILYKLVGLMLLLALPFIFVRQAGLKSKKVSRKRSVFGLVLYFSVAIYDGLFSAGGGIFINLIFIFLLGFTYLQAYATGTILWLVSVLVSIFIFAKHGLIHYFYGILLFVGMILGGYLGAHLAVKKGDRFIRLLFAVFVVFSAVKFLFF